MGRFDGKVAVITGGGGILCSHFAEALAREGAAVAVLDLNAEAARKVADKITGQGGDAIAVACDVLDKNSIIAAKETVDQHFGPGGCDILINGAGGNNPKCVTTKEVWEQCDIEGEKDDGVVTFYDLEQAGVEFVFNLNFLGTFLPVQVFSKDMAKKGNTCILNMSSMSAYAPLTKIPAYSGAKAAVSNFTSWLAVYFAGAGIRVNALAPGFFLTAQNHNLLIKSDGSLTERSQKIINHTPMRRFGTPDDLTGALYFLCDNNASAFITGVVLPVDGGFMAYSGV